MHCRRFLAPVALGLVALFSYHSAVYASPLWKQIGVVRDGVAGYSGLAGVYDLVFSADGSYAYSAAYNSNAVSVFSVNQATGALTQQQILYNNFEGVSGIEHARAVRLSPDGKHAYVAGEFSSSIGIFARDSATGLLTFNSAFSDGGPEFGLWGVNALNFAPDGNYLYASSESRQSLNALARDPVTGALTHVQTLRDGIPPVNSMHSLRSFTISADGRYLYGPARDDNAITQFDRDATTGELTVNEVVGGAPNFDGPTHITFSPDGLHAYVASQFSDSLSVFDVDAATGHLLYKTTYADNSPGFELLNHAEDIVISADGTMLMITATIDNALSIYFRNPVTGELTFHQSFQDGVNGIDGLFRARELILSPDGQFLYVMSPESNAIAIFQVPEPGSVALALVGLVGLPLARRVRKKN